MQYFKGEDTEIKFDNSGKEILNNLGVQLSLFFNEAYNCHALGDLLYDNNLAPLARTIKKNIFRQFFFTLFNWFIRSGSFESYIAVFKSIFGDDCDVTFTVLAPGKLEIDIVATGIELNDFIVRSIVDNEYVYDTLIDQEGDTLQFQNVKGFESQYEVEQMLFEFVPNGIYTTISLTIGS